MMPDTHEVTSEGGFSMMILRSKVCYMALRLLIWAKVYWNLVISYSAKDEFEILVNELQTIEFLLLTIPWAKLTFHSLMNTWENAHQ